MCIDNTLVLAHTRKRLGNSFLNYCHFCMIFFMFSTSSKTLSSVKDDFVRYNSLESNVIHRPHVTIFNCLSMQFFKNFFYAM